MMLRLGLSYAHSTIISGPMEMGGDLLSSFTWGWVCVVVVFGWCRDTMGMGGAIMGVT